MQFEIVVAAIIITNFKLGINKTFDSRFIFFNAPKREVS